MLTDKQKNAMVATIIIGFASALAIALGGDPQHAGICRPCDCAGAVQLPADATAAALPDAVTE